MHSRWCASMRSSLGEIEKSIYLGQRESWKTLQLGVVVILYHTQDQRCPITRTRNLKNVHELIVVSVRKIQESLVTDPSMMHWASLRISFCHAHHVILGLLISIVILVIHAVILNLPWLSILHPLPLLQLVEEHQVERLKNSTCS